MAGYVDVPKFADFRNKVKRHSSRKFPVLSLKDKTTIAIHHSLTRQGLGGSNAEGYARYHVDSLGWPSIGYNYVIEPDGTIKFCNDIELRTYHVGDHNNYAIGICLTGDFRYEKPTKTQEESLRNLVQALQQKYPHLKYIKGHNEFSGYEWKKCPEFDYKAVLSKGGGGSKPASKSISTMANEVIAGKHGDGHDNRRKSLGISQAEYNLVRDEVNRKLGAETSSKPKGKSIAKMVQEVIDGKHGNGHANRRKSLGVSSSVYNEVKAEVNRRLSGKSSKPKSFKPGQRVTLKKSADKYATGQHIPPRYLGKTYTIQQAKSDRVLLKELYSWVYKSDVY